MRLCNIDKTYFKAWIDLKRNAKVYAYSVIDSISHDIVNTFIGKFYFRKQGIYALIVSILQFPNETS